MPTSCAVSTMPIIVPEITAPSTSTDDDDATIIDVTDDNEALLGGSLPAKHTQLFAKGPDGEGTLTTCPCTCREVGAAEPGRFCSSTMERRVSEGSSQLHLAPRRHAGAQQSIHGRIRCRVRHLPARLAPPPIISWFALGFGESDSEVEHLTNAIGYAAKHCAFPHGRIRKRRIKWLQRGKQTKAQASGWRMSGIEGAVSVRGSTRRLANVQLCSRVIPRPRTVEHDFDLFLQQADELSREKLFGHNLGAAVRDSPPRFAWNSIEASLGPARPPTGGFGRVT